MKKNLFWVILKFVLVEGLCLIGFIAILIDTYIWSLLDFLVSEAGYNLKNILLIAIASLVFVFLSPIGDIIDRLTIKDTKSVHSYLGNERAITLFKRVKKNAVKKNPLLAMVSLYIVDDLSVNAHIKGGNTIYLNKGAMNAPDRIVESIIAHEFGHIHRFHWIICQLSTCVNIVVTLGLRIMMLLISILQTLLSLLFEIPIIGPLIKIMIPILDVQAEMISFIFATVMESYNSVILCTSHKREYNADNFAVDLGYGNELKESFAYETPMYDLNKNIINSPTHPSGVLRTENVNKRLEKNYG